MKLLSPEALKEIRERLRSRLREIFTRRVPHGLQSREDVEAVIDAMEEAAGTSPSRDEVIEECAKVAEKHDYDAGVKKLGPANYKYASDEARAEFAAEARGEKIASEMIAKALRSLKGKP